MVVCNFSGKESLVMKYCNAIVQCGQQCDQFLASFANESNNANRITVHLNPTCDTTMYCVTATAIIGSSCLERNFTMNTEPGEFA